MGVFLAAGQAFVLLALLRAAGPQALWLLVLVAVFVIVSTLGILVWIGLGRDTFRDISRQQAVQAEGILDIVIQSLPHLRQGLNPDSASAVSLLVFAKLQFDAVSITDTTTILSFVGEGENHHLPGSKIKTTATIDALHSKEVQVLNRRWSIGCPYLDCPLHSAIVAPLIVRDRAVGALKLYYSRPKDMGELEEAVALGLARLLSSQLELAELDGHRQATLAAELRALQAQINPHFLFNSLNTIAMFCRTKPGEARRLVLAFAEFFRHSLQSPQDFITVREELEYVDCYLDLERARYGQELAVQRRADDAVLDLYIPPLTIQPLVENAIKHGKGTAGKLMHLGLDLWQEDGWLQIRVIDDGAGFDPVVLAEMQETGPGQEHGIGIFNVHRRLKAFFGERFDFVVVSGEGHTEVGFSLPVELCLPDAEQTPAVAVPAAEPGPGAPAPPAVVS